MNPSKNMRTKKAVSPLVATVLLIAFAVALGAVALTIAQQIFTVEVDCDKVVFSLREGPRGEAPICYTNENLIFFATNQAEEIPIDNFRLVITPLTDTLKEYDQTFNNPEGKDAIVPGSYKRVSVPYAFSENGDILEVSIIPIVRSVLDDPLSEWKACAKSGDGGSVVTVKNVPKCT